MPGIFGRSGLHPGSGPARQTVTAPGGRAAGPPGRGLRRRCRAGTGVCRRAIFGPPRSRAAGPPANCVVPWASGWPGRPAHLTALHQLAPSRSEAFTHLVEGPPASYAASVVRLIGSMIAGSSFSGLSTRVETGHIRIKSAGYGRIRSRRSGSGRASSAVRRMSARPSNATELAHRTRLSRWAILTKRGGNEGSRCRRALSGALFAASHGFFRLFPRGIRLAFLAFVIQFFSHLFPIARLRF